MSKEFNNKDLENRYNSHVTSEALAFLKLADSYNCPLEADFRESIEECIRENKKLIREIRLVTRGFF